MPDETPEREKKPEVPRPYGPTYYSFGTRVADGFAAFLAWARIPITVMLIALTAVSIYGLTKLHFNAAFRKLFASEQGVVRASQEIGNQFGGDNNVVLVVLEARNVFTPAGVWAVRRLDENIQKVTGVASVLSLADMVTAAPIQTKLSFTMPWPLPAVTTQLTFRLPYSTTQPVLPPYSASRSEFVKAKDRAENLPLVEGWLLSEDEKDALLIVRFTSSVPSFVALRPDIHELRHTIDTSLGGTQLPTKVTGVPIARLELLSAMEKEQAIFMVLGVVVGALIVGGMFRRFAAAVTVLTPAIVAPVWIMGLLGLFGGEVDPVNSVTPVLVLIIVLADGVHVVHTVRGALARGDAPPDAARAAVRMIGPACFFTSLTTAISFGSLVVARVHAIQDFAMLAAAGVLLGELAVMTIAPLLCGYVFKEHIGKHTDTREATILPNRVANLFLHYPFALAAGGTIATIVLGFLCQRLEPSTSFSGSLPRHSEARETAELVDREFGGSLTLLTLIEWQPPLTATSPEVVEALRETQRVLRRTELVSYPISYLDLLTTLLNVPPNAAPDPNELALLPPSVLGEFLREDLHRTVIRARIPDVGSHLWMPVIRKLGHRLVEVERRYPGVRIIVTGTPVGMGESAARMIHDLALSLASAAIMILLVIAIAARSWRIGLVVIMPNALPLAFAGAWLVLTNQVLTITGVITFDVLLGIAVDDTIHMIHRFKWELAKGGEIDDVLRRSFRSVGKAVVVTTAVFVTGLGLLLFSNLPGLRMFGQISCIGLTIALVGDLVFLPALLKIVIPYLPERARKPWGAE